VSCPECERLRKRVAELEVEVEQLRDRAVVAEMAKPDFGYSLCDASQWPPEARGGPLARPWD
jgi:hypothetical protein